MLSWSKWGNCGHYVNKHICMLFGISVCICGGYPTTSVPAEATITSFDKLSLTYSPKYHGKEGTLLSLLFCLYIDMCPLTFQPPWRRRPWIRTGCLKSDQMLWWCLCCLYLRTYVDKQNLSLDSYLILILPVPDHQAVEKEQESHCCIADVCLFHGIE